jgi:flagellin-like hook-associated protein FlgL
MADVVLSTGVRQNLLSLQNTARLMSLTQNRLATGKKVNTALDNPSNYFGSLALSNRAGDLNALLDSIGQAQQTLDAADKGISSLVKLVESAKSIASQARKAPQPASNTFGQITLTGTSQAEVNAVANGGAFGVPAVAGDAGNLVINIGGTTYTVALGTGDDLNAFVTAFNNTAGLGPAGAITASNNAGALRLTANNADVDFTIDPASTAGTLTKLGGGITSGASFLSTSLLDNIVAAGGTAGTSTLVVSVNGSASQTLTFGTGPGQISTQAELNTALGNISGLTASVSGTLSSFVVGTAPAQNNLMLTSSAGVDTALGIAASVNQNGALLSTVGSDPTRTSLQADYNTMLAQIDALANDASYNGVNLLAGDTLKVVFNESGSSVLNIAGLNLDSASLGLPAIAGTGFQSDSTIDSTITALNNALSQLRNDASKFGSNLNTVQARQDFTKGLIATLESGADMLVLADTNEEGANMLALQTRQSLSTTALSLSAQADQAVLRLFG